MELFHDHEMVRIVEYESLWDNLGMSDIMGDNYFACVTNLHIWNHQNLPVFPNSDKVFPFQILCACVARILRDTSRHVKKSFLNLREISVFWQVPSPKASYCTVGVRFDSLSLSSLESEKPSNLTPTVVTVQYEAFGLASSLP